MRTVDALAAIRSSRFDLPLTYDAGDLDLQVGDVVRVPLGTREVLAYIIRHPERSARGVEASKLKPVIERLDVPRAFDETGLHLAEFIAEHYLCTLGEALSAVVLADAVPRMRDSFVRTVAEPNPRRYATVPPRLLRLIWSDLPNGFTLEQLLRHPEARRAGDHAALQRAMQALVRSGDLRRERRLIDPRTREYRVRVLEPGSGRIKGKKAVALVDFVREQPGVPRADALLAGFTSAVITRTIKAGALREREITTASVRATQGRETAPPATREQAEALRRIDAALEKRAFAAILLYGVTGSGKTYVYVEAIKRVVKDGGRAIVLVPEISLTPQTARRFEAAFGERVAVLHSALSQRERFEAWQACRRGEIDVVVGARSAVFAPLPNARLIVVDESHDASYKQDSTPRYHAVTVARERMRRDGGVLILGSATPSIESYAAAKAGRLDMITLRERATQQPLPTVRVIDLAEEFRSGNRRIFSNALVQALNDRLERDEKSVLFVNRRGSAASMLCRNCGATAQCPRCSVALSVHRSERLLRCHYCDYQTAILEHCAICGDDTIREFGIGTEKVVEEVLRLFPRARVLRMDSDTTTRVGDHARILSAFGEEGDVLVGTQMVTKGLDYPTVTLVGVVAADVGLHLPDFRAAERSLAMITQVCGRSGRARAGEAIVQTYAPEHPSIVYAARHDYDGFAERELRERVALGFPPARRLVYLGIVSRSRAQATRAANLYAQMLQEADVAEVLGPAPYPIARMNDEWRYRIAVKTQRLSVLREFMRNRIVPTARNDRNTRLIINVDP